MYANKVLFVLLLLLAGVARAQTGGGARFQGLGNLPGRGPLATVGDISADGTVVVGTTDSSPCALLMEAYRWTSESGGVGLCDLFGRGFGSQAFGTSEDGAVVVGLGSPEFGGFNEAFRWTSDGGMVGLGFLPGAFFSRAHATSANGTVVVGIAETSSGSGEAFRWTAGGGMVILGHTGGGFSVAQGISSDGTVVVGQAASSSITEAFRWTAGGGMVSLGRLNGENASAQGISSDGMVVVGWADSAFGRDAFRWTSDGGMVALGDLSGGSTYGSALDTSSDGAIIVGAAGSTRELREAFRWTDSYGMHSLRSLLIDDFGLNLSGWQLTSAKGISDDGMTIAGDGINPAGFFEGWLAFVPPKAALIDFNNPAFIKCDPGLPTRLASDGTEVEGLAADGVTPVLIRIEGFSGQLEFEIEVRDENGSTNKVDVGTLKRVCSDETGNPLTIESVFIEELGNSLAYAVLESPMDFARNQGDNALAERPLTIEIRRATGEVLTTLELKLVRPPVVFLHGLEDFPESWHLNVARGLEPAYPPDTVLRAHYPRTHASRFSVNQTVTRGAIASVLVRYRAKGLAVTQADVVGHSMGGNIARAYATDRIANPSGGPPAVTGFRRPDNFDKGDIHKLITIGTPHRGSPVSDVLVTNDNELRPAGLAASLFVEGPDQCDPTGSCRPPTGACSNGGGDDRWLTGGAVADLRTDSSALKRINETLVSIPVHAIVGTGGSDGIRPITFYWLRTWAATILCGRTMAGFFEGEHDLVVSKSSQEGGLAGSPVTYLSGQEGRHYPEIACFPNGSTNAAVLDLLNASTASNSFADGFPVHHGDNPGQPFCLLNFGTSQRESLGAGSGIAITSPEPGVVLSPGQTLHVSAEATGEFLPGFVVFNVGGAVSVVESPPFKADIDVPLEAIGTLTIRATAADAEGVVAAATPVTATATTTAVLDSLVVEPNPVILFAYISSQQLEVRGLYSDGIERALICTPTFEVADATVIEASPTGVVTARTVGASSVVISLGKKTMSVPIQVISVKGDADGDGKFDLRDFAVFQDCFEGDGRLPSPSSGDVPLCLDTFDFDGDSDVDLEDYARFQMLTHPVP